MPSFLALVVASFLERLVLATIQTGFRERHLFGTSTHDQERRNSAREERRNKPLLASRRLLQRVHCTKPMGCGYLCGESLIPPGAKFSNKHRMLLRSQVRARCRYPSVLRANQKLPNGRTQNIWQGCDGDSLKPIFEYLECLTSEVRKNAN